MEIKELSYIFAAKIQFLRFNFGLIIMTRYSFADFGTIIADSYGIAKSHGFHAEDANRCTEHFIMLIVSELGEVIEADRKGKCCDLGIFDDAFRTVPFKEAFETYVKDSIGDEFADIVIRLADLCGVVGVRIEPSAMDDEFEEDFGDYTFTECAFVLNHILVSGTSVDDDLEQRLGSALSFVIAWCHHLGIDLEEHVSLKMAYNDLRPMLNGKRY